MPSREDKIKRLRRNVEINTRRAIRQYEQETGHRCPDDKKRKFRKAFEDAAKKYNDPVLASIWND